MRFSAVGRGRWGAGTPWAWPGAAGGPSWPSLSPLQPWSCSSWCGWSGGRRSGTPSSCSSTPRTTSGTTSSSMMKREVERRIRWGETLSCGQGAAGQSVLSKKAETTLFLVKHMQRVVFYYLWQGSFIGFPGVMEGQQVQDIQDIPGTLSCASRTMPGGLCHRDFSTPRHLPGEGLQITPLTLMFKLYFCYLGH